MAYALGKIQVNHVVRFILTRANDRPPLIKKVVIAVSMMAISVTTHKFNNPKMADLRDIVVDHLRFLATVAWMIPKSAYQA